MEEKEIKIILERVIKVCIIMFILFTCNCIKVNAVEELSKSKEWQQKEYWQWHTRTTTKDKAYNGEHIVIENDTINFWGYGVVSYKDFLYKEYQNNGKKIFSFRIDESKANYHTLDGAGIIFNSKITDNKLSGYVLVFKQVDVCLYRLDEVDIQVFETTPNTTLETYAKPICSVVKISPNIHDVVVETSPASLIVKENNQEIINEKLDYSKHVGNDFGLISSYVQHDCEVLSKIQFSQFDIQIEDYKYEILNTNKEEFPITGGQFQLKDENKNIILEEITNENGIITITGLKPGKYTVKQTKAPSGYIINNEEYDFVVTEYGKIIDNKSNEVIQVIVKNNKKIANESKIFKDNTMSNKSIPKAGIRTALIILIILALIVLMQYYISKKQKSNK